LPHRVRSDIIFAMKRLIPWLLLCSLAGACAAPPAAPTRMSPSATPAATQTPMIASSPTPATGLPNSIELIASDMSDPHEALLSGVPAAFDWHRGPRLGRGNTPGTFKAIIAWGQVYAAADGNPARNTRVQIGDIQLWILSKKTGRWTKVQREWRVDGSAYREDFANDANKPADARREQDDSVAIVLSPGYNYHFWPVGGRSDFDNTDVAGVFSSVRARLIVDDHAKPDDRAQARLLLGMGADYWINREAGWDPDWKHNGDVAIGRMRWLTPQWQSYNMTSLSAEALRANPPPIEVDERTR
jgi:hypothetical protein